MRMLWGDKVLTWQGTIERALRQITETSCGIDQLLIKSSDLSVGIWSNWQLSFGPIVMHGKTVKMTTVQSYF